MSQGNDEQAPWPCHDRESVDQVTPDMCMYTIPSCFTLRSTLISFPNLLQKLYLFTSVGILGCHHRRKNLISCKEISTHVVRIQIPVVFGSFRINSELVTNMFCNIYANAIWKSLPKLSRLFIRVEFWDAALCARQSGISFYRRRFFIEHVMIFWNSYIVLYVRFFFFGKTTCGVESLIR